MLRDSLGLNHALKQVKAREGRYRGAGCEDVRNGVREREVEERWDKAE